MRGTLLTVALIVIAGLGAPVPAGARPVSVPDLERPRDVLPSRGREQVIKRAVIKEVRRRAPVAAAAAQPKARIAVSILGATRPPLEQRRKKPGPATATERIADAIETLYKGPLRAGTTSLYVADARTGAPVFAVDPDQPLNPASNVKLISTATALDLLGPEFRYLTRILGRSPDPTTGEAQDLYLLGSFDPTLRVDDLHRIAVDLATSGVKKVTGDVVVGTTATRDGIYRALIPIDLAAADTAGAPLIVSTPAGYDFVTIKNTATTKRGKRGKLTFTESYVTDAAGHLRLELTIAGTIGKGKAFTHWVWTRERSLHAAYALRAGLRAAGVEVTGAVRIAEFDDVVASAASAGWIPLELARHESARFADIVAQVNKRSINWLSDRVVMTAAARAYGGLPSMELAIDAMYRWLGAHTGHGRDSLVVDTGSGLSRLTQFSTRQIVDVLRIATGLADGAEIDPARAEAYYGSLSIAGSDGTLRRRFKNTPVASHLHGKTGTLSDVVALSGILDIDPDRPLAFALVTNGHPGSLKVRVKNAHEQLVGLLCDYLQSTRTAAPATAPPPPALAKPRPSDTVPPPTTTTAPIEPPTRDAEDVEETDDGAPEATADREDVEQMVKEELDHRVPAAPAP